MNSQSDIQPLTAWSGRRRRKVTPTYIASLAGANNPPYLPLLVRIKSPRAETGRTAEEGERERADTMRLARAMHDSLMELQRINAEAFDVAVLALGLTREGVVELPSIAKRLKLPMDDAQWLFSWACAHHQYRTRVEEAADHTPSSAADPVRRAPLPDDTDRALYGVVCKELRAAAPVLTSTRSVKTAAPAAVRRDPIARSRYQVEPEHEQQSALTRPLAPPA